MAQLSKAVEPFGEVNVYKQANGDIEIVATILMVPDIEGARTGLALDASASMTKMYGISGIANPGIFGGAAGFPNVVEPVARTMASYLANFSSSGKTALIYWACSPDGSQIEEIGDIDGQQAQTLSIAGVKPHLWGRGTKLLPPVKYFVENRFKDAKWGIVVFITDGIIEDLDDVKKFCLQFGQQIAAGKRHFIKLVLIGVGEEVDEGQMEELDDMFEGSGLKDPDGNDIDLWDHKLASEMKKIEEIFAEVVSENTIVAASGRILNNDSKVIRDFPDGVPALLRFSLPVGSTAFKLEFPGGSVTQDITEGLARI
jgi:hypothetical protein